MSSKHITIAALTLVLIGIPIAVVAGNHFHGGGPGGPGGPGGFFGGFGPGLDRFLDHAACRLDLSDAQTEQIEAILDASRPQMETLHEQAAAAREAFHSSFDPGAFDEAAATAFAQGQSEIHTQMMVLGLRTLSEVWDVLTPEQREELEEMHQQRQECRGKRGHGKRLGR